MMSPSPFCVVKFTLKFDAYYSLTVLLGNIVQMIICIKFCVLVNCPSVACTVCNIAISIPCYFYSGYGCKSQYLYDVFPVYMILYVKFCTCARTHTHTHTHICRHTQTQIQTHRHTDTHTHTRRHTQMRIQTHTRTQTQTQTQTHTHTHTHTRMDACIHTQKQVKMNKQIKIKSLEAQI